MVRCIVVGAGGVGPVVTHSGVTLAPFLGRAVAEEIARGRAVPQLDPFRPARFAARGSAR